MVLLLQASKATLDSSWQPAMRGWLASVRCPRKQRRLAARAFGLGTLYL